MEKRSPKKEEAKVQIKSKTGKKKKIKLSEKEKEEERNGIIPEGMDFKKFLGCGG